MNREPRWLRFAQALALISGVSACSNASTTPETGPGPSTGNGATGGGEVATDPCPCSCDTTSVNPAYCGNVGHYECCPATIMVGPLSPPDLPG